MQGAPPTPMTSVSLYVCAMMLLAALTTVVALLVVRRRQRLGLTCAFGLVTLVLLCAGGIYLTTPPRIPTDQQGRWQSCPYDRIIWSNMRPDVDEAWQPCRRMARVELAVMLVGAAAATAGAAARVVRRPSPALPARGSGVFGDRLEPRRHG